MSGPEGGAAAPDATAEAASTAGADPPTTGADVPTADTEPTPGERVVDALHDPVRAACDELRRELERGLFQPLREGIERHRQVADEVGLAGDAPDSWERRLEGIAEYRRTVASALLEPLSTSLSGRGPSTRWVTVLGTACRGAVERCGDLPAEVEDAWSADALDAHPSDGALRRMGKVVARVGSRARRAGEPRTLPLRAVAERHARVTLPAHLDRLGIEVLRRWGAWSDGLEKAWIRWGDRALPALVEAGLPEPREGPGKAWAALREAASELDATLRTLLEEPPHDAALEGLDRTLDHAGRPLAADLAVAGSFLLRPGGAPSEPPRLAELERRAAPMEWWETGVAGRLRIYDVVLGILTGATAVQSRLVEGIHDACLRDADELPALADRLADLARSVERRPDGRGVRRLGSLGDSVTSLLEQIRSALPKRADVESVVQQRSDAAVEALLAMVRRAPDSVRLHPFDATPPRGARAPEPRDVPLQQLARQSFDALRIERIRAAAGGIVATVDQARADLEELVEVVSFAFEAAREETDAADAAEAVDEADAVVEAEAVEEAEGADEADESEASVATDEAPPPDDPAAARDRARGLVTEALGNVAGSLRSSRASIDASVAAARSRLAVETSEGSFALLDRIAAGRVEARLLAARSTLASVRAWIHESWSPPVERTARATRIRAQRLWRNVSGYLRRGSELVAGAPPEASSTKSMRALTETEAVISSLPLVYQRLFTLDPIADRTLLSGRSAELAEALARWTRWRAGDGVPLVMHGRPGNGITTFLNVLVGAIRDGGATAVRVDLEERVEEEAELAALLADAVELAPTDTLDQLAAAILSAGEGVLPEALAVDDMEHAHLRAPGGTELVDRLLTLMTETEPRIFWVGGIASSAWQLIRASEPSAVAQVDALELPRLSAEALREAITARHRRSGLPVRFEEPDSSRVLLRRRLRRMGDPDAYQELLASDFFDQLYRTSSGHIGLGLFQWLAAADFEQGEGVTMRPPEKPNLSVLDALELQQNFTLKAFLEHRSLTLGEHDRIFRMPRHESYQIFEALGHRHLIEPIGRSAVAGHARSEIRATVRYRVRPLLVGAVVAHLQGRNIVH